MTKRFYLSALAAGAAMIAAPALAGEINGPPPGSNLPDAPPISNGNSFCSFSGLNDTPDGFGTPGTPEYDPGGIAQSFGYFHAHGGLYDPSSEAQRNSFAFPAVGCNPTRGPALHG